MGLDDLGANHGLAHRRKTLRCEATETKMPPRRQQFHAELAKT